MKKSDIERHHICRTCENKKLCGSGVNVLSVVIHCPHYKKEVKP